MMTRRPNRARDILLVAGLFSAAVGYGVIAGRDDKAKASTLSSFSETLTNCRVVDGDTLRCGESRVRLLGIDAPELPGHCREGRDCAPGDAEQSTRSLEEGMGSQSSVTVEVVGADRYGRTLAMVQGQGGDLSCWQLTHGQAIYKPNWDNGGQVAAACPNAAR